MQTNKTLLITGFKESWLATIIVLLIECQTKQQ